MSGCAAHLELPSGERIEMPAEMPDVTEADGTLWDWSFELPESVKKLMEWADEAAVEWDSDPYFLEGWLKPRRRINFNPPEHWETVQDKRCNTSPLGRCSYLHKARRVKSLARSAHIRIAPHRGTKKNDVEQCKHTFKITDARCAPCGGYNVECKHYEGNDAADTKHCPR